VPGRESTRAASASAAATSTFTASCDDDHERAVTIAKGQVRFRGQRAGLDLPLQARPQTGKTLPIAIQRQDNGGKPPQRSRPGHDAQLASSRGKL
jgi:hypothetical protein